MIHLKLSVQMMVSMPHPTRRPLPPLASSLRAAPDFRLLNGTSFRRILEIPLKSAGRHWQDCRPHRSLKKIILLIRPSNFVVSAKLARASHDDSFWLLVPVLLRFPSKGAPLACSLRLAPSFPCLHLICVFPGNGTRTRKKRYCYAFEC